MTTAIIVHSPTSAANILIPTKSQGDEKSRLSLFVKWLDQDTAQHWTNPDLAAYADYLQSEYKGRNGKPLTPSSASTHLSTIRGRYNALLTSNAVRQSLYESVSKDASAADKKAIVDEIIDRMKNATSAGAVKIKVIKHQDTADDKHMRLTRVQADTLINKPGTDTLIGLRDTALIALALCTGLREMELCALDVDDLRKTLGGELSIHVREGKGSKARLIPYGELSGALVFVDAWLKSAGITSGAVFRGFYKGGKHIRNTRLTVRAVNDIVSAYPLVIDGVKRTVKPHDLRRTYARRNYEYGIDPVVIQQNLGHSDLKTTMGYIGTLDANKRRPGAIYTLDTSKVSALV